LPFTRGGKWSFFAEKSSFFLVEKYPFSLKSALLFEKKAFTRGEKYLPFYAETSPFKNLKSALLFEKKKPLQEGQKYWPFYAEKCPF